MAKINNIKKFRQRFVKDYNLPINVFDDNLFEYYIQLYDFFPYLRYKETIEKIENEYDGCVEKWLEYCASVRDNAINGVMETDEYKKFNSMDLSQIISPQFVGSIVVTLRKQMVNVFFP